MERKKKIILWAGAFVVGAIIAATAFNWSSHPGPQRTLGQYMRTVVEQGTLADIAQKIAAHVAGRQDPGFDSAAFERTMESCLHQRIDTWLHGDDPRRDGPVIKEDVDSLAAKFASSCVTALSRNLK